MKSGVAICTCIRKKKKERLRVAWRHACEFEPSEVLAWPLLYPRVDTPEDDAAMSWSGEASGRHSVLITSSFEAEYDSSATIISLAAWSSLSEDLSGSSFSIPRPPTMFRQRLPSSLSAEPYLWFSTNVPRSKSSPVAVRRHKAAHPCALLPAEVPPHNAAPHETASHVTAPADCARAQRRPAPRARVRRTRKFCGSHASAGDGPLHCSLTMLLHRSYAVWGTRFLIYAQVPHSPHSRSPIVNSAYSRPQDWA